MGVASKKKRPIDVDGRRFYWYVAEDLDDFPRVNELHAVNILSDDKHFIVRFHLDQVDARTRHITVIGREFVGSDYAGCWRRFLSPAWCPDGVVTPNAVRGIIQWCLNENNPRVEVDCRGERMPGAMLVQSE